MQQCYSLKDLVYAAVLQAPGPGVCSSATAPRTWCTQQSYSPQDLVYAAQIRPPVHPRARETPPRCDLWTKLSVPVYPPPSCQMKPSLRIPWHDDPHQVTFAPLLSIIFQPAPTTRLTVLTPQKLLLFIPGPMACTFCLMCIVLDSAKGITSFTTIRVTIRHA